MGLLPESGKIPYVLPTQDGKSVGQMAEMYQQNRKLNNLGFDLRADFGAVGDGVTSCTTAMADALAALLARGGGRLFIPDGTFLLDDGLTITGLSNFEIFGPGVLMAAEDHVTQYVRLVSCTDFTLRGVGSCHENPTSRKTTPARAFSLEACERFVMDGCHAFDGEGIGIMVKDCLNGTVSGNLVESVQADGIGLYGDTRHVTVIGNIVDSAEDDGISAVGAVGDETGPQYCTIIGNTLRNLVGGRGIAIVGAYEIAVVGNTIDGTKWAGLLAQCDAARDCYGAKRITFANNIIRNANRLDPDSTQAALFAYSGDTDYPVEDITFINNYVENSGRGAQAGGTSGSPATNRIRFIDNKFENISGLGFQSFDITDLELTGNTFTDIGDQAIFTQEGTLGIVRIAGNTIRGANSDDNVVSVIDLSLSEDTDLMKVHDNIILGSGESTEYAINLPLGAEVEAYNNSHPGLATFSGQGFTEVRGNLAVSGSAVIPDTGGGVGMLAMHNATVVPADGVTGGGVLYPEAGALKWKGSSGTVTTIAPA